MISTADRTERGAGDATGRCASCGEATEPGRRSRGRCRRCHHREYMYAWRLEHRPVPDSRRDWPCAVCGRMTTPHTGRALGRCGTCYQREYRRAYRAAGGR